MESLALVFLDLIHEILNTLFINFNTTLNLNLEHCHYIKIIKLKIIKYTIRKHSSYYISQKVHWVLVFFIFEFNQEKNFHFKTLNETQF